MKKYFFALTGLFLLFSCGNQPIIETYSLSGNIPEPDGEKLVLYRINKELVSIPLDTVSVKDSSFTFVVPKQNPDLAIIKVISDPTKKLAVILGDGNVHYAVKDKYGFDADITGSTSILTKKLFSQFKKEIKENEKGRSLMQAYRNTRDEKKQDSIKKRFQKWSDSIKQNQYKYIEENKDITGLVVMQSLISSPEAQFGTIHKIFNDYPEAVKKTGIGKYINVLLLTKGATDTGGKAPNFIAPTPEGKRLSLNQAMGKVTLIDFWASWCRPCRAENPYVVSLYKKYHDRGFNIIGVSLDKNKRDWMNAIKQDSLEWQHVSNLKFWQEPIAKLYGVSAIPQTFLLNSQGIIVAKNLRGKALEEKIVELLEN
jgi:thiol-disulfide isomerase/thioredoxin